MLEWAKSMTFKGLRPVVGFSRMLYEKGISLSKEAMQAIEAPLIRNPLLPIGVSFFGNRLRSNSIFRYKSWKKSAPTAHRW